MGATVYIIRERPKLNWILPNVIFGIEFGTCLPEMLVPDDKVLAMELLRTKLLELNEKNPPLDSHAKLSQLEIIVMKLATSSMTSFLKFLDMRT